MEGVTLVNPEKNPRNKDENNQQTQPTYEAELGIELGSHCWEASALTTAPFLLPYPVFSNLLAQGNRMFVVVSIFKIKCR